MNHTLQPYNNKLRICFPVTHISVTYNIHVTDHLLSLLACDGVTSESSD